MTNDMAPELKSFASGNNHSWMDYETHWLFIMLRSLYIGSTPYHVRMREYNSEILSRYVKYIASGLIGSEEIHPNYLEIKITKAGIAKFLELLDESMERAIKESERVTVNYRSLYAELLVYKFEHRYYENQS